MLNRRFTDLVRLELIQLLARKAFSNAEAPALEAKAPARYREDDVVAFIDLQNLHYFLKDACQVHANQVHLPNLFREFAAQNGLKLRQIHVFTGIHSPEKEPEKHEAMRKRLEWLRRCGCAVTALPLSYMWDAERQGHKAVEKGIDVRMSSEVLRAVTNGLRKALLLTQDRDINEGIAVAREMALERGAPLDVMSVRLTDAEHFEEHCAVYGLDCTIRLNLSLKLIRKHTRPFTPRAVRADESTDVPSGTS